MRPESATFLWDALAASKRIESFVAGRTAAAYRNEELRKSAVERQFEILGEALNRLRKADPDTAARIPNVNRIIGMRNILAHGYAIVDDGVVWEAATARVPEIMTVLEELLAEVE